MNKNKEKMNMGTTYEHINKYKNRYRLEVGMEFDGMLYKILPHHKTTLFRVL